MNSLNILAKKPNQNLVKVLEVKMLNQLIKNNHLVSKSQIEQNDSLDKDKNTVGLPQGHIFGGLDTYDYRVAEQYHHILTDPSDYIKIYNSAHKGVNLNLEGVKSKITTNHQENVQSYESPAKRRIRGSFSQEKDSQASAKAKARLMNKVPQNIDISLSKPKCNNQESNFKGLRNNKSQIIGIKSNQRRTESYPVIFHPEGVISIDRNIRFDRK